MPFRNQEEALRHRVETLERELGEARDDIARVSRLRSPARLFVGALLLSTAAVVAGWLIGRENPTSGAFVVLHPQSVALESAQELVWSARVTEPPGTIPVDTPCAIVARLTQAMGDPVIRSTVQVEVRCGDDTIYRTTDASTTTGVMLGCGLQETQIGERTYRYRLSCTDQAADSGATQLTVDTHEGVARIWREGPEGFELHMTVDPQSAERTGAPLLSSAEVREHRRADREGVVTEIVGTLVVDGGMPARGVRVGSACRVGIEQSTGASEHRCVAFVRCADETLYGRPGYGETACLVVNGQPRAAVDAEPNLIAGESARSDELRRGDPVLLVDLPGNRAVVASNHPSGTFLLTIRLSPG